MDKRLSFLGKFGMELGNTALSGFISALAKFDPKTASAADIAMMEDEVKKAATLKVDAAHEIDGKGGLKEHLAQLEIDRDSAITALGILQNQHAAANDAGKADIARRAAVIDRQIGVLEDQIKSDRDSLAAAQEWLGQVTEALEQAATNLSGARQALADAQREAKSAKRERETAEQQAERTKQLAGIRGATSHLGVAIGAMKESAASDRKAAAVTRETAGAIGRASTSGMDEVHKVLGHAEPPKTDPFARLKQDKAA